MSKHIFLAGLILLLVLIFAQIIAANAEFNPVETAPADPSHPDTNPPAISEWFTSLHNHQGGQCCGEADGYPAEVIQETTSREGEHYLMRGVARITDPSRKEIWKNGHLIKTRDAITSGDLTVKFSYMLTSLEKYGNPLPHALVFVRVTEGKIDYVYCVVPLAPLY